MVDNVRSLQSARQPWDPAVHAALPGVRFVTPTQYLAAAPQVVRRGMVNYTVIAALAEAADVDGVLLDFDLPEFYRTHVAKVLSRDLDEDEQAPQLVYDTFTGRSISARVASVSSRYCRSAISNHTNRNRGTCAACSESARGAVVVVLDQPGQIPGLGPL
jgi:hypothetical protein